MPVPQLPIELIQLIVADSDLTKADLQSLSLAARVFPPLVRPRLFMRLRVSLGWISKESDPLARRPYDRALNLREMDRLMGFRLHLDLATHVKAVCIGGNHNGPDLQAPPGSLRMSARDLVQLVYTIFARLEEATSVWADFPIAPPRLPLPCCQTLHTIRCIRLDLHAWGGLQTCTALRKLSIEEILFEDEAPAVPPSLPFRLETLELAGFCEYDANSHFLGPFLRACGATLKHLWLGINYDNVPDLAILPRLVSLGVNLNRNYCETRILGGWFATALPTCATLERLAITTTEVGFTLAKTPLGILASPEVAAALPSTLQRIDFDRLPYAGELEAALSNNKCVKVIGMPTQRDGDHPWLDFCRRRGIEVVDWDMNEWPA